MHTQVVFTDNLGNPLNGKSLALLQGEDEEDVEQINSEEDPSGHSG